MVSETKDKAKELPWQLFLSATLDGDDVPAHQREAVLKARYAQVEAFRTTTWPSIKDTLLKEEQIHVPEGLEPHWVAPGKAVYWQEQIVRQRVQTDEGIQPRDVNGGWKPTKALPAANASVIAHYLRKGLRFRPPEVGAGVEMFETAVPLELQGRPPQIAPLEQKFFCKRHEEKGVVGFPTWTAYLRHCEFFREGVEEALPPDVEKRQKRTAFFCVLHDVGFYKERLALQHINHHKHVRGSHIPLEAMRVPARTKRE